MWKFQQPLPQAAPGVDVDGEDFNLRNDNADFLARSASQERSAAFYCVFTAIGQTVNMQVLRT